MRLQNYLEEALVPDKEDEKANTLVRMKNNLRARIKKAEQEHGSVGEIESLRRQLRDLQYKHNKLKTQ